MGRYTRREFVNVSAQGVALLGATSPLLTLGCQPPQEPLRILILGGTRFIGPHQVKYALDRGHRISIFTRGQTQPPFYEEEFSRVEHLIGDRNDDLSALEGREWDAVIDNSASYPRWVQMTTELLRENAARYLFVSSISAYRDFTEVGITEEYPVGELSAPDVEDMREYGPMKARCEELTRESFGEEAIIVRPGLIIGPGDNTDRWTYWPVRVSRGGEVLAPNDENDPIQNIDARDLSEWIVRLVETPGNGGTYNATGHILPVGGMLETVRDALGAEATFTWVPTEFLTQHGVSSWVHMTNWVPPEGDSAGMLQVSVDRAVSAGLTFRDLATTVRDTMAWWETLPAERRETPRAGLPSELEQRVLEAWHARGAAA